MFRRIAAGFPSQAAEDSIVSDGIGSSTKDSSGLQASIHAFLTRLSVIIIRFGNSMLAAPGFYVHICRAVFTSVFGAGPLPQPRCSAIKLV